jgi:CheY-like chemotaxis protein
MAAQFDTDIPVPYSPGSKRILVVDDQPDAASAMADLLRLHGHEVYEANDGRRAIEFACELRPNLILLDIGMPRMDGLQTAREIRRLPLAEQPLIVATTGWGDAIDRLASEQAGIDVHLVKPVEIEVLLNLL